MVFLHKNGKKMKKILKVIWDIILFHISLILYYFLTIINFILVRSTNYFRDTAVNVDRYGNRDLRTLWNKTLIKSNSKYRFGDINETISSVLGRNQVAGTLTFTGKSLASLLDLIDKNHCVKSIGH